ncbi:ornithine cyclodeaminase family protein [Microlunatus speluncae]|uniref:ornithine cyclodeaminase family protein n=1 Tax=Microlunatus speluncae TaxID=2594267 RepID=UPI001C2DE80C|nr:ornithine cyclodeaminase family protein [Microlunatus speluncae]
MNPTQESAPLRLLSRTDLADVPFPPEEVVAAVEQAYRSFGSGTAENPTKITVGGVHDRSVAYAMLGRDTDRGVVAMKTSYTFGPDDDRGGKRYTTMIMLYDDTTGAPIALLDGSRIGALRTPAVSALLVRETKRSDARSVLVIGTGVQGRNALPHLLAANPELDRLMLFGTHAGGIDAVRSMLADYDPARSVEVVTDPRAAAGEADVILATAGPATRVAVESSDLRDGSTVVLVGYGLAPSTLVDADRAIATNAAQMAITGRDMAGPDGTLRPVDAELPAVITGRARLRQHDAQRIFAFNSGIVLTDIAVAHALAQRAIELGRGVDVTLWS